MAKPRIFVSSTFYDLKHIRSSMDNFIDGLGYESILSEKGDIAYSFDVPLDESCYREIQNIDIFVLIIGGRYGSEISKGDKKPDKKFFDRYESITKKEYDTAFKKDIPIYILIETNVHSEYRTFLQNKSNKAINYAHVDSVNIFHFIEEILSKPRNNPIHHFEKFEQIEKWLKEQWAGSFKELLSTKVRQNEIKTLSTEISELQEINKTLKTYLEAVLSGSSPDNSSKLIESEKKRLEDATIRLELKNNKWFKFINTETGIEIDEFIEMMIKSKTWSQFMKQIKDDDRKQYVDFILQSEPRAMNDLNESRRILGLKEF
ncbi:uncharacterized protein DUF4062 [Gramella sp. Hel_I_59]|uniref:DUF4062 domain-containing protein n=1 Tax=Gramella sp. Hel_I_59 TaxID=1249978 RepID=UPI00114F6165|nr:DUF4062 domain-containing protein [Gramella sp. Hel_I_59]TQI71128.1 uncharacterized protein DUF4062 [Gramella sp. Hel_I_59]